MNTQITEDYVSFEIAKLLKEKGFPQSKDIAMAMYNEVGMLLNLCTNTKEYYVFEDFDENDCVAVSQAMAMKWLREVHKKNINIIYDLQKFQKIDGSVEDVEVYEVDIITKNGTFYIGNYNHYESACEAAIKYCLTNLI